MKILEEKHNPLLKRKEVKIIIEHEKNPSMEEASKLIAEKTNSSEECIAIKSIKGKFGRETFLISAMVYENKKDKEDTEQKKKVKKTPGAA